jgi:hypothetical protein
VAVDAPWGEVIHNLGTLNAPKLLEGLWPQIDE